MPVGRKRTTPTLPRNASPLERRELASALYRAGMHEEALREFRALVEEAADPVASFHVGLIALRQKEGGGAVNAFMTAAPEAPSKTSLLHNLALAYEQLGQLEKARLVIDRALESGGNTDPLIQLQAAVISMRLGDMQAAKVRLSEARSLWTTNPPPAVWFHYAAKVAATTDDPDREMFVILLTNRVDDARARIGHGRRTGIRHQRNPLAGLHPRHSDLPILAAQNGVPYVELIGMIFEERLTEAVDPTQRCAQIVRNGVTEGL